MDIYFWLFAILAGIPLWWFAYYATKQMRVQKNAMREEQAKKNLAELARQQAAEQAAEQSSEDANQPDTAAPVENQEAR